MTKTEEKVALEEERETLENQEEENYETEEKEKKKKASSGSKEEEKKTSAHEDLAEMLQLMDEHELAELEYEDGDRKIRLKKQGVTDAGSQPVVVGNPPAGSQNVQSPPSSGTPAPSDGGTGGDSSGEETTKTSGEEAAEDANTIKSPLVGTFYRAPAPDADPFIEEGDRVDKDTVVCIIEAMKVMNEIKAEVEGTVRKVLVNNGEPVDFDQPLFEIIPDE